ncbi:MAG TPA: hypothetical protein PKD12_12220 [Nitrospira sp.]|nr:hypothetical protein [Nitrospira sp.]
MFAGWNHVDSWALRGFITCVLAEVLFVLVFDPFPTVDMAAHLASARGVADIIGGGSVTTSHLLEWNFIPPPNLLPQLVLGALVPTVGSLWAERCILVTYVIVFSLSAVWAIRQTRPGTMLLSFFVLPLTFNLPFLWGFLNFSYSIAGFLFVAGLLMRWDGQLDSDRMKMLALALVLVFFTHLVGYLEAGLLSVCMLGAACILSDRPLAALTRAAMALSPAAVLTLVFLILTGSEPTSVSFDLAAKLAALKGLISLTTSVATYDRLERVPCVATGIALWILLLMAAMRGQWSWIYRPAPLGLAAFVFLSSVVAVFAPSGMGTGGTLGSIRYALFPILGAILWLAYQPLPPRIVLIGATVACLAALSLASIRHDELRAIEIALQDLRNLESCVSPDSTVVQANLRTVKFGSLARPSSLVAETGRLTAARKALDLSNVDWSVPFGLLRFREETNPYTHLVRPGKGFFRIESVPPPLDLEGYEHHTNILVDYIVVFGRTLPTGAIEIQPPEQSADLVALELNRFESTLNQHYVRVRTSSLGIWELWGRRLSSSDERLSGCQR